MSRARVLYQEILFSFPRVSGDEPQAILDLGFTDVFSPRERG